MNPQTIIQAMVQNLLIENAKMQAYDGNFHNMHLLITVATGQVVSYDCTMAVMNELRDNPELYK